MQLKWHSECSARGASNFSLLTWGPFWVKNAVPTYVQLSTVTLLWEFWCFQILCNTVCLKWTMESENHIRGNGEIISKIINYTWEAQNLAYRIVEVFCSSIQYNVTENWHSFISPNHNLFFFFFLFCNITT